MKKIFFFLAALMLTFTAQATIVECNPGTNNLAWYLTQGDTLVLADGIYEEAYSIDFNKLGVCVKAAEGAKPVIKLTGEYTVLDVQATTTFEGITFDAGNVAKYLVATTGVNPGTLTINNCEFRNWTYWALSNQFEETASIDSVIVNNTIFHDGAEAAISFNNKAPEGLHSCNYFSLTNSTIYNVKSTEYAGIVHVSSNGEATGKQNTIIIDHVTMYNLDGADLGIIAVRKSSDLTISNTIIANPAEGERASYVYGGVAENVIYYNVSQDGDLTYTNCLTDDPKFVDATNGNFALAEGSPALTAGTDGKAIGDPRWNVVAEPEPTTETVYFINTKKWAAVKAHVWGGKAAESAWPGKATVKETEKVAGYDVYSFTANVGDYANIIFNNNNGGSQTPDLVWTAGKYYVIDMGWLTKEEAETKLAAPLPETWNIVGAAGLMGKDWDLNAAENAMTKQEDGTYKLEKKGITIVAGSYEYKAAKDHGWTVAVPQDGNQTLKITTSGIYDVTFVLNVTAKTLQATATLKQAAVVIPTVIIAGDMNSWSQTKDKFTMSADSLTATFKATLAVKNYGFKMIVGGAWHSDGKTITRAANSTKFTGANSNTNSTLKADIAGEYLFTWEYATKTLTVTYPALPVKYNVTVTAEHGTVTGAGTYEEGKTATLTATANEGYQFVNWTKGEEVVSTENPYSFVVTADVALVANFELIPPTKYNVSVTAENGTVEGAGEYEEGTTATLTATANEGYEFVNWTVGEEVVSTENPYTFTVTADIALVANFQATEPVVEVPAASVRAWAYDLALAVEGEQYTFSYKATTAALATLIFTDVDGEELATKDLGLVEAGANTVVLAADELPAGQKVNWAVKLEAGAIANFVELTDASKGIYNFYLPQGVAVDNNPESSTFGNIYVAAATNGASDGSSNRADTQKRGIFIYDQELNELNPTSNVGIIPSNVTLGATSRQAMKRIVVNPLTNEVAFAHNAAPLAVWAVAAENVGGEAKNLIEGLGFTSVNALCFTEDGALYVMESAGYPAPGSLYKVVNGVVDTIFANNTRFGNADLALVSDNRGGIWICQNRGQLDTFNQLTHVNAAGEIDFEVNTATPNGFESKNTARGTIAYNPAEDILAMSLSTEGGIGASLYQVAYDETTGVPSLTFITSTPALGTNVDGLAFDYAGDLYALSANKERLYKYAVPTDNNVCTTPAAAKYAFQIEAAVVEPVELVGVVKRALTIGESTVVLTHEADGTAHIYNIVGEEIAEVSLEGVVPVNPDNLGDYLAISDIAVTEDGKLVARNYMRVTNLNYAPDAGYERGENRFYIWNDLAGAPSVWFTSLMTSNSIRSDQGITMAVKGTSTNAKVLTTGVHNSGRGIRMSLFTIKDGKYVDPNGGAGNKSEYYWYLDSHFKSDAVYNEAAYGVLPELSASPLGENNWIMDNVGMAPSEFSEPADGGGDPIVNTVLADDVVGKKYNGTTYLTIDEQAIMVAPYATAEGLLAGVKVLDITAGLASATEVAVADLDAAVEATAAATAVVVDEDKLIITLVGDATLYTLTAELTQDPGPGTALDNVAVEAKAIKMIKNGQLIIIKNGVQYNVQGQVIK